MVLRAPTDWNPHQATSFSPILERVKALYCYEYSIYWTLYLLESVR